MNPASLMRLMGAVALAGLMAGSVSASTTEPSLWANSLFADDNGGPTFNLRGRVHNDWGWVNEDDDELGSIDDGTLFRRARLGVKGQIAENTKFKAEYDFAGGGVAFRDVYLAWDNLFDLGTFKIGHFKEPLGLDQLTSSNDISFMERALTNGFAPARNTGVMFQTANGEEGAENMTIAVGLFRTAGGNGNDLDDGDYSLTARATGLLMQGEDNKDLVHVGLGASYRGGSTITFGASESGFVPTLSGVTIAQESTLIFDLEAAGVFGPFSAQAEFAMASVDGDADDFDGQAWHLQGSYMLTGEQRNYCRKTGTFKNPTPSETFTGLEGSGSGAWEALARISSVDLNDGIYTGGEQINFTLGLNWYMSSHHRTMINYIHGDHDDLDGTYDALAFRFQWVF